MHIVHVITDVGLINFSNYIHVDRINSLNYHQQKGFDWTKSRTKSKFSPRAFCPSIEHVCTVYCPCPSSK